MTLPKATPDHSTLANTGKRLPRKVFQEVFQFVLSLAEEKQLIHGETVGGWIRRRWRPTRP